MNTQDRAELDKAYKMIEEAKEIHRGDQILGDGKVRRSTGGPASGRAGTAD